MIENHQDRVGRDWEWATATPESQGLSTARLEAIWNELKHRSTTAFIVIRGDRILFEQYAPGYSRTTPHYTASLAKALVGGVSLMLAMDDGRIRADDPASKHVPQWADDPKKQRITVRHLATHTSGIEDAEADGLPHDRLTGWKGDFWKRLAPPHDPFTLARDRAPVLDDPGARARYSNPGMAMLAYCVTASLHGAPDADLRSLLKRRILDPLGVPDAEGSCGYGAATSVEGMSLVANWGGGSYSANATARIGRLMLHQGEWDGRRLLSPTVVEAAITHAGMPSPTGLGWWVNQGADGNRLWQAAPTDAFWGAGAGQQLLLVVPSLDLIAVRNGELMDSDMGFDAGLETYIVGPLMEAFTSRRAAPYAPSPVIEAITWAAPSTIVRQAFDCDCWPLTWGDDDSLYTAYGDGYGFEPRVPEKLSLGFARIMGSPPDVTGVNIGSATGEQKGEGAHGRKASGILMVNGVLYLWVRNAGNAQLAWSEDHGQSWRWGDWRFTTRFGCPTFLNFGRNYAGARDESVYCEVDIRMKYSEFRAIMACAMLGTGYGAALGAIYAVLAMGGPSLMEDLQTYDVGTTLIMRLMMVPYGAIVGAGYGYFAGCIGGALGSPLGWSLGGLFPGLFTGLLILVARSAGGMNLVMLLLLWTVFPSTIGVLVGLYAGHALRRKPTTLPGAAWLIGVVSNSPLIDDEGWRDIRERGPSSDGA